ncbi:MAG: DUF4236 domain-containing protein [Chthoniobacterales bacterium]
MSFRFRRSFSIIPGLKLNLGKKGASISVGPKGAKITVGKTGLRATAGVPGTGLSVTKHVPLPAAPHHNLAPPSQVAEDPPEGLKLVQTTLRSRLAEINVRWLAATIEGMDDDSFTLWVGAKSEEFGGFVHVLDKLLTVDLGQAVGAESLVRVVDQVAATMDEVIQWEAEVRNLAHVPRFRNVAEAMSGWSRFCLDCLNHFQGQIDDGIAQFGETHHIVLTLKWGDSKAEDVIAALAQFKKEAIARAAAV